MLLQNENKQKTKLRDFKYNLFFNRILLRLT
jgi:hypothetical protein